MTIRHNWTIEEVAQIYHQPFLELIWQAMQIHRTHFAPNAIQVSGLENIKIGGCPEDCAWCGQSIHNDTGVESESLADLVTVLDKAKEAKANGVMRYCMAASWRNPSKRNLAKVVKMVQAIKELGLETCITVGKLTQENANELKQAGLDYYNHNLESSEHYFKQVTSRNYQDRLNTLQYVRNAGIKVCSGGIIGMGETLEDRFDLLITLANQPTHPQSVPINKLVHIAGTPLEKTAHIEDFDFIRCVALARIMMPKSYVRLSGGRKKMSQTMQALCFAAGANSIHHSPQLLVTPNASMAEDVEMIKALGLTIEKARPTPIPTRIPTQVVLYEQN